MKGKRKLFLLIAINIILLPLVFRSIKERINNPKLTETELLIKFFELPN